MNADAKSPARAARLLICTGDCCNTGGKAQRLLAAVRTAIADRDQACSKAGATPAAEVVAMPCLRRSCLGECVGVPVARLEPQGLVYYDPSPQQLRDIAFGIRDPKSS